jgi:hypothetical protein
LERIPVAAAKSGLSYAQPQSSSFSEKTPSPFVVSPLSGRRREREERRKRGISGRPEADPRAAVAVRAPRQSGGRARG